MVDGLCSVTSPDYIYLLKNNIRQLKSAIKINLSNPNEFDIFPKIVELERSWQFNILLKIFESYRNKIFIISPGVFLWTRYYLAIWTIYWKISTYWRENIYIRHFLAAVITPSFSHLLQTIHSNSIYLVISLTFPYICIMILGMFLFQSVINAWINSELIDFLAGRWFNH